MINFSTMSGMSFNTPKTPSTRVTGTKPKAPAPPLAAVSPTQIQDTPEQSRHTDTEFFSARSQVAIHFIQFPHFARNGSQKSALSSFCFIFTLITASFTCNQCGYETVEWHLAGLTPLSLCFVITLFTASFTCNQCDYETVGWGSADVLLLSLVL